MIITRVSIHRVTLISSREAGLPSRVVMDVTIRRENELGNALSEREGSLPQRHVTP